MLEYRAIDEAREPSHFELQNLFTENKQDTRMPVELQIPIHYRVDIVHTVTTTTTTTTPTPTPATTTTTTTTATIIATTMTTTTATATTTTTTSSFSFYC
jgi:hypothetical protein